MFGLLEDVGKEVEVVNFASQKLRREIRSAGSEDEASDSGHVDDAEGLELDLGGVLRVLRMVEKGEDVVFESERL